MTCNRFEEINKYLHSNDNSKQIKKGELGHDSLFKIRPFLNMIKGRYLLIPKEEYLAVDEQIILQIRK